MFAVVEDPSGARATVHVDAVPEHKLRGFVVIGEAVNPGDPRTVEEAAQEAKDAEAARAAAVEEISKPVRKSPAKKEK